jgi:hypothetical protein
MQRVFQQTIFLGPAMAANHAHVFAAPFDMQLIHVSASNSTTNQGKLDIGTTSDVDAYLDDKTVGELDVPAEFARADFIGTQFPHIADGTLVIVTITDHASHMANVSVVLTFTEG